MDEEEEVTETRDGGPNVTSEKKWLEIVTQTFVNQRQVLSRSLFLEKQKELFSPDASFMRFAVSSFLRDK